MKPDHEMRFWSVFSIAWFAFVFFCIVFLLSSCGVGGYFGEPACTTRCGMMLQEIPDFPASGRETFKPWWWSCDSFQQAEDETLQAFQSTTDPRLHECKNLRGWRVYVQDGYFWWGQSQQWVAGETYCGVGLMLANIQPPRFSSLPHEMAHAMQFCIPQSSTITDGHDGWQEQGIYSAIDHVWDNQSNEMRDAGAL